MSEFKTVSYRLPAWLVDTLDVAKWELRKPKVGIIEEALQEYFERHGIFLKDRANEAREEALQPQRSAKA